MTLMSRQPESREKRKMGAVGVASLFTVETKEWACFENSFHNSSRKFFFILLVKFCKLKFVFLLFYLTSLVDFFAFNLPLSRAGSGCGLSSFTSSSWSPSLVRKLPSMSRGFWGSTTIKLSSSSPKEALCSLEGPTSSVSWCNSCMEIHDKRFTSW